MRFTIVVAVLISLTSWAARPTPAADNDLDALHGNWKVTQLTFGEGWGELQPQLEMILAKIVIRFEGDTVVAIQDGVATGQASTLKLDERARPKLVNIVSKNADGSEQVIKGIYALDGDSLKFYFGLSGQRPAKFPSGTSGQDLLMVLTRMKPAN